HPGGRHRRPGRRRDDPSLDARGQPAPQGRRRRRNDRALPDTLRDRQARRRQFLSAQAVQRADQAAGAAARPLGLKNGIEMTANGRGLQLPPLINGLSARVLVLTAFFVMLSEVLIYAPSAGRFREDYLKDRLATAHVAVLSLLATPNNMVSDELQMELLHHAGAYVIALRRANGMKLVMRARRGVPMVDVAFDLG